MNKKLGVVILIILISIGIYGFFNLPKSAKIPLLESQPSSKQPESAVSQVTQDLEIPWELAFLPEGEILVTQRKGQLSQVAKDGTVADVAKIEEVLPAGEGGLLGLALHPEFDKNSLIYLYYTYSENGINSLNRVVSFKYENGTISDKKVIVDKIPGARNHNGGRIKFGPDGFLYITTGDAQEPSLAQNTNSLAGKILRVTDSGRPAPQNPFGNLVYSYGHRNPQGLAWDSQGRLWTTEHGSLAHDEVNIIEPGKNYGWPQITGSQTKEGLVSPVLQSNLGTWAPSGASFLNDSIYFAGLRSKGLFQIELKNNNKLAKYFEGEFGRIRTVVVGPDNFLYITTNNKDGRGDPQAGDDKILKINPEKLK